MKRLINISVLLVIVLSGNAQQNSPFSQYIFNQMLINPAYVGTKQQHNLNATYSKQWAGFDGSPSTQTISAEGPITENMGYGAHFINDHIGAQYQQGLFGSYAYYIKFNEVWKLSLGLAVGLSHFMLDGTKLTSKDIEVGSTAAIPTTMVNRVRFDSKAGLFLYSRRFYFGFSASDLLASAFKDKDLMIAKPVTHLFITSGYVFDAGKNLKIKPSILYREDLKAPANIDLNLFFLIREKIWLGASARFGANIFKKPSLDKTLKYKDALIFLAEWNITRSLRIGYAYTWTLSSLSGYSGHEIEIGYSFPKKNETKMTSPRFF
jgi:type IX secretion system PorP/SprF family membrane protein